MNTQFYTHKCKIGCFSYYILSVTLEKKYKSFQILNLLFYLYSTPFNYIIQAYAATYNNIMDYASKPNDSNKNVKFQRNTFTKWQWDRMLGNIKRKSYLATISGGHTNGFSDNNPYLDGSDVEIEQFVNELNKIF